MYPFIDQPLFRKRNSMKYVFILVGLLSLLSCKQKTDIEGQRVFWHNLEQQYAETTALLEEQTKDLIRETERDLEEPWKEKYALVGPALRRVSKQYERMQEEISTLIAENKAESNIESAIEQIVFQRLDSVIFLYNNLLLTSGERPFGLSQQGIELELTSFEQNRLDEFANWKTNNLQLLQTSYAPYALLDLYQKIQMDRYKTIEKITWFTGGIAACNWWIYFPIVTPKHSAVRKNQAFEAEISVGTYSSDIDPKDLTIIINNDTLPVNSDGRATLVIPPTYRTGEQALKLQALVRNPLTGEVSSGDAVFRYQVIP
jgi:hypothetical protein